MSRRGRLGAAAAAKSRAEGVAADAARRAAAKTPYTLLAGEEFRDNPRRGRKSSRAQKAGLAKGQSLMQQAAAAYRAGKYASMQDALRGVARGGSRRRNPLYIPQGEQCVYVLNHLNTSAGLRRVAEKLADHTDADFDVVIAEKDGDTAMAILREGIDSGIINARSAGDFYDEVRAALRRRNPLSENGMIVNGAAAYHEMRKGKKSKKVSDGERRARFEAILERVREQNRKKAMSKAAAAKRASTRVSYAAEEYMDNPRRKGSKAAKSAQGNAAKAMSLYRSGRADSLAEAWAMVKRRA
jgi:hypothetical protein